MAMNDLFTALNMFKQGVNELQLSRAISGANEQVQQVRAAEMKETEKRQALQQISQQLVGQMTGLGANPTQIQQMAQSIAPTYSSPAQLALEGVMTGNRQMVNAAKEADLAGQFGNIMQTAEQLNWQSKEKELDRQHAANMRMMDIGAGKYANKMQKKQGDVEFNTNFRVAMNEANKLEKIIGEDGNWEMFNEKSKAQLDSAAYQLAINYAKIVDPASVAREGEVEAAKKYLIPMGLGTRNKVSLEAVKEYKEKLKEYMKARHAAQADAGLGDEAAPAPTGNPYFIPYKQQ